MPAEQAWSMGEWAVVLMLGGLVATVGLFLGAKWLVKKYPVVKDLESLVAFVLLAGLGFFAATLLWEDGARASWLQFLLLVAGAAVAALYLEKKWLWGAVCGMVGLVLVLALGGALFSASGIPQWFHERWNQPAEEVVDLVRPEDVQAAAARVTEETLRAVQARGGGTETQASVPIQITEVVKGKAWRFVLCGTDIGTAAAAVRAQNPETTIHVKGGHTYRFSAAGAPAGTVHLTSLHVRGDPEVKDLRVRSYDVPRGYAFLPSRDSIATVWVQGTRGPVELTLTETSESPAAVRRTSSYFQQSSATGY